MRRVLFLPAGPSKSSMSYFSHILMFANPFPFCFKMIFRFLALSVPLIATGFSTEAASLQISSDGWDTWTVPLTTASGDIGRSVTPGTGKDIVWSKGTINHAGANYCRSSSNSHNQSSIGSPLPGYVGLSSHTIRHWGAIGRMGWAL